MWYIILIIYRLSVLASVDLAHITAGLVIPGQGVPSRAAPPETRCARRALRPRARTKLKTLAPQLEKGDDES